MSNKEVATKKDQLPALEDIFNIKENMEGIKAKLPCIEILHSAQMFNMPDEEKVGAFKAKILYHRNSNVYWETKDSDGPPDCSSLDSIRPDSGDNRQADSCIGCPMNAFGSGFKGIGKACKNTKKVYVTLDDCDSVMPYEISLPAKSIGPFDDFITKVSGMNIAYQIISVSFSLEKRVNAGGNIYSVICLSLIKGSRVTERDEIMKIKAMRDEWLPIMRKQEHSDD